MTTLADEIREQLERERRDTAAWLDAVREYDERQAPRDNEQDPVAESIARWSER